VIVVPGSVSHPRSGVRSVRGADLNTVLQCASEGEARLLRSQLSLAAEAACSGQLVALSQLLRLSQARGHLCAGQAFVHEIHGVTSVSVGLHGWMVSFVIGP
jgi:hypothetical protein